MSLRSVSRLRTIPLQRAEYLRAWCAPLIEDGAPVARLLERSGLPNWTLEEPNRFVLESGVWNLASIASRDQDLPELGARAGNAVRETIRAVFGPGMASAPTVITALQDFCVRITCESNTSRFWVQSASEGGWLYRQPYFDDPDGRSQMEAAVVRVMIEAVRLAAGTPDWMPERVRLQSADDLATRSIEDVASARTEFNWPATGLHICGATLSRRRRPELPSSPPASGRSTAETAFLPSFRQLLDSWFVDRLPQLESVARALGTSPRTLQRLLSEHSTSYQREIDYVRAEAARRALRDSARSLSEIGRDLGFAAQPHFTRAFRRWFGTTPSAFRKTLEEG